MIENLTVQFNSIDNTSVAGSIRSVRSIISARTELGPEPRYDDDTIGREDSTDQLPLPDVDNEMRPGSVQDRTGVHTIEEEPDEDAAGVHPDTGGIPTELGYDGPIITEIIDDERQQRTAAPDGQGGPDERAMRAQRRREPLQVPAISKPGDGRRMSLAGTGDLPSRAPYTPIPRVSNTHAIPDASRALASLPAGQTSALYNARPNNRLARGSVRSPVATPIVQRVAPQPQAAGYPIGAVPTDSISRMVINTLQAHQNDVDSQRNLGRKGLKLEPLPTYDGAPRLRDFEEWISGVLRYFRMNGLCGPTVADDNNRVFIIGHLCTGKAQSWFHKSVEKSEYGPEGWTTLEVIQGLQRRFLTTRSATIAAHEFRTLKQGTMDAQELYEELNLLADQQPI
ncbi:Retroviral aspartyl protease [Ceratobasidium sp. AG-Ba]|nr:Retroviral aspartyl protease [Ceratobasidium sp. AG-Ba]